MTFVIASACIDVLDKSCIEVCPVDCIFAEDEDRMCYIEPNDLHQLYGPLFQLSLDYFNIYNP